MFAWATACQPTAIGAVSAARGAHERRDEVLVRFPEGAELGNPQAFLVEAPACVLGLAFWCRGVGVLDLDEPAAPACRQGGRAERTPRLQHRRRRHAGAVTAA